MDEKGAAQEIVWLSVDSLHVDNRYQRNLNLNRVRAIVSDFSWMYFEVLSVSKRDDGSYWVTDGSHRLEVARRLAISRVPCVVYSGLLYTEEARKFKNINAHRGPPKRVDTFKADVQSEDPDALAIIRIAESRGFKVSLKSRRGNSGGGRYEISAVGCLEKIYMRGGAASLDRCLRVLDEAYGGNSEYTYGHLISGLARFLEIYEGLYDERRLIREMASVPIEKMRNRAAYWAGMGHPQLEFCWSRMIVEVYNHHLSKSKLPEDRLYKSDFKETKISPPDASSKNSNTGVEFF